MRLHSKYRMHISASCQLKSKPSIIILKTLKNQTQLFIEIIPLNIMPFFIYLSILKFVCVLLLLLLLVFFSCFIRSICFSKNAPKQGHTCSVCMNNRPNAETYTNTRINSWIWLVYSLQSIDVCL